MDSNWDQFCNFKFYILTIFQGEGKQAAVQRDSTSAGNPPILLSNHLAVIHLALLLLLVIDGHTTPELSQRASSTLLPSFPSLSLSFLSIRAKQRG